MKNLALTITIILLLFANDTVFAQTDIPYSADEILERCIQFHDPEGKWENYSGKINLVHVNANGINNAVETIEIDVKNDFYLCTHIRRNGAKIVKGLKNKEVIRTVNDNPNPSEEEINKFSLNREQIVLMKTWHYFHFGKVMHLKNMGFKPKNGISTAEYNNKSYYEIKLVGDENETSQNSWTGDYVLTIDKETFALHGMQWTFNNRLMKAEYRGMLDVNGIKNPMLAMYSEAGKDNIAVDLFSKVIE